MVDIIQNGITVDLTEENGCYTQSKYEFHSGTAHSTSSETSLYMLNHVYYCCSSWSFYQSLFQSGKNAKSRIGLLLGFAFCTGFGLGPLLDTVIRINPAIIPTAFLSTSLIFACFSLCSLLSPRGQYLMLGAPLLSLFSILSLLFMANIFIGSTMIFQMYLYIGFAVMCGFVLYDTQLIIAKRRLGDKDFVWHSVDLFIDFVNIFRYLLIILAQKDDNQKRRKN